MNKAMTLAAAGDAILLKRIPEGYEPIQKITEFINTAEAKLINVEMVLSEFENFPNVTSGGTWMNASPDVADDLVKMGFNLFGLANNHAMDYSYGGIASTCKALRERKMEFTGIGENLYEASRPAVLDLPRARVGVISVCTTFDNNWRAGEQGPALKGRPGLNFLRFSTEYIITAEQLEQLRQIAADTLINVEQDIERRDGFLPPLAEGTIAMGNNKYRVGEKTGTVTKCNPGDKKRLLDLIKDARRYLDYVVVMVHSHEMEDAHTAPAMFYKEFAREAIDAGACAIIGGGCHQLRPIEMYKGKPIIYSLGNFFFQTNAVRLLPYDFCDKLGFDKHLTAAQALDARSAGGTRGLHSQICNFRTVIPYMEFEENELKKLILKPVDLGFTKPLSYNGLPHPADEQNAEAIYNILTDLSAPYGTKMKWNNENIEIIL